MNLDVFILFVIPDRKQHLICIEFKVFIKLTLLNEIAVLRLDRHISLIWECFDAFLFAVAFELKMSLLTMLIIALNIKLIFMLLILKLYIFLGHRDRS